VIFWVFFVPLNIFWAFPGLVLALKDIKKKKIYRIGPSQRPDPTRSARTGPAAPAHGPSGPSQARRHRRPTSACAPSRSGPIKGRGPWPHARPCPLLRRCKPRRRPLQAAPPPASRRTEAAGVDRERRPLPFLSNPGEHSILVPSVPSSFFPRRPSP
jgi:hypothetical protein